VTEDSYRVGTADDVDDVDQLVDDDVPADAPRIHGQIIHVTIRDGAGVREFDVHVTNRDYLAWDMTGPKRGWDMRSAAVPVSELHRLVGGEAGRPVRRHIRRRDAQLVGTASSTSTSRRGAAGPSYPAGSRAG
jgi:hypothetical protein